jgi:hypothetical protein
MSQFTLRFTVSARFDVEASVWCGQCPEIGVFAEGRDLDELVEHCRDLVPFMLPDYGYAAPAEVFLTFSVEDGPCLYAPPEAGKPARA